MLGAVRVLLGLRGEKEVATGWSGRDRFMCEVSGGGLPPPHTHTHVLYSNQMYWLQQLLGGTTTQSLGNTAAQPG